MTVDRELPEWVKRVIAHAVEELRRAPTTQSAEHTVTYLADQLEARDKEIAALEKQSKINYQNALFIGERLNKQHVELSDEIAKLEASLASAQEDKKRLDKAQELYFGADFAYKRGDGDDAEEISIALVKIPDGVRVGIDFRAFLDTAMQSSASATVKEPLTVQRQSSAEGK